MLYNELPIAFPWYEKLEQQNRYNENVQPVCDYKLISPANALLPFQFVKQTTVLLIPTLWEVFEINSMQLIADISSEIPTLDRRILEAKEYVTYFGDPITGLDMAPGYYYSRMTFPDGTFAYSEMFFVPDDKFNIQDDDDIEYLRVSWYNQTDLRPVFYNNLGTNGVPKFKNVIYLDSFITASEPEVILDGDRDGEDELIATFQKVLIPYRLTVVVPDFLKKALMVMQIHDIINLTTQHSVRSGTLPTVKVNSALEASGGLSIVDIIFQETILVKKGCGENMV